MTRPAPIRDPTTVWLRRLAPVAHPWARLVCLPHSGGTAAFFRSWRAHLPPDVELYAAQYPGRLDRIGDPAAADVDQLAGELAAAIAPLLQRPTALFGHSLGATVAYEVARRLADSGAGNGRRGVAHLFASGSVPPHRQRAGALHQATDDVLWAEVRRLGGTRPEVVDSPELRASFLPALRNDYRLAETYRPRSAPPLECPVSVLLGDQDDEVSTTDAHAWGEHTRASFTVRDFAGGHFYLTAWPAEVVGEILRQLARHTPGRYTGGEGP